MLRVSFTVDIHTDKATFEIQFGSIERPTHTNTMWDLAKDECPAMKWADLSQRDYGVALLNDCKYGYRVKKNVLDLNLLRSVVYPRDPLEPGDDSRAEGAPRYGHTDQDDHVFTYALYPHAGDHVVGGVVRQGYELNHPLRCVTVAAAASAGKGQAAAAIAMPSLLTVSAEEVVVDTVKAAEDGSGCVVFRMYESAGSRVATSLHFGAAVSEVVECDMMETPLPTAAAGGPREAGSAAGAGASLRLQFLPYEVKTLLVTMSSSTEQQGRKRQKR